MEPDLSRNRHPSGWASQEPESELTRLAEPGFPPLPTVCVGSDDELWAELVAQNLSARGVPAFSCGISRLTGRIDSMADGSWVIVDGGWPMLELQNLVDDLNPMLSQPRINSVMVADDLLGPHPLDAFRPDTVIRRTPDMRVFVRDLLSLFHSPMFGSPFPGMQEQLEGMA